MKIKLFAVMVLCFCFSNVSGQNQKKNSNFKDRIFIGGNLGANFGNITLIEVSPIIGYRITEKLSSGIGGTYLYYKDNRTTPDFETHIYGGRIFSQYEIIENILAYTEFEVLNLEMFVADVSNNIIITERDNVFSWLVGGAYVQPIGSRSSINIYLLWDVIEDENSPYTNPIIRIGFNAGI